MTLKKIQIIFCELSFLIILAGCLTSLPENLDTWNMATLIVLANALLKANSRWKGAVITNSVLSLQWTQPIPKLVTLTKVGPYRLFSNVTMKVGSYVVHFQHTTQQKAVSIFCLLLMYILRQKFALVVGFNICHNNSNIITEVGSFVVHFQHAS